MNCTLSFIVVGYISHNKQGEMEADKAQQKRKVQEEVSQAEINFEKAETPATLLATWHRLKEANETLTQRRKTPEMLERQALACIRRLIQTGCSGQEVDLRQCFRDILWLDMEYDEYEMTELFSKLQILGFTCRWDDQYGTLRIRVP